MKKILILTFALVMTFGAAVLFTAAANGAETARESIAKVAETFDASEPIYQKLNTLIAEEIAGFDSEDESDYNVDESKTAIKELDGYGEQLRDMLSGLSGLSDSPDTSDGKTVRAAREYLTMLQNMTADLSELIDYSVKLYEAVLPMESMYAETDDYEELADQIWNSTETVRGLLENIKPPSYLSITHGDLIARVTEFRDFALDFYIANQLGDPLRTYSCMYRMNRIVRMFDICNENLNADLELQIRQADHRMSGIISTIHDELTSNLAKLKNA